MKKIVFPFLRALGIDRLFQYMNREKILMLAYHGITSSKEGLQPWTMVQADAFEEQIEYISRRYHVLSLQDVVNAMQTGDRLPENPAVITFDDGYRNNLTLALPVLRKYQTPATIFLTAGYVGTEKILPLDEAFLIVTHAGNRSSFHFPEIGLGPLSFDTGDAVYASYLKTMAALKKMPVSDQMKYIRLMAENLAPVYSGSGSGDDAFRHLSWNEVGELLDTGLIGIGAHTVSHQILSQVSLDLAEKEILDSKYIIEANTGRAVTLFAYPNGTDSDYNEDHIRLLKEGGFSCSVTTTGRLNKRDDDPYRLGRICVGPDFTVNPGHFALKVSGFNSAFKKIAGYHGV